MVATDTNANGSTKAGARSDARGITRSKKRSFEVNVRRSCRSKPAQSRGKHDRLQNILCSEASALHRL